MSSPQLIAANPALSAGVRANAGTGKTWTLVTRVARLLLTGARPDAILCVTYTKAAAAEMQTRLFERLGAWSVMDNEKLASELAAMDEGARDLPQARALFAKALETPGGLKIQTLHSFCEKLLRRFPIEAGLAPGFDVIEDAAQARLQAKARDRLAHGALDDQAGPLGEAYAHMAVHLDERSFDAMLTAFAYRQLDLDAYVARVGLGNLRADIWRRCGFIEPTSIEEIEAQALAAIDPDCWRRAAASFAGAGPTAEGMAGRMLGALTALEAGEPWVELARPIFQTKDGGPQTFWDKSKAIRNAPGLHNVMLDCRAALLRTFSVLSAARMAQDTEAALTLGLFQAAAYKAEKAALGALDFDDLTARAHQLLTSEDGAAAWVLFKLDWGIDHLLLDEAQDTAPAQWHIIRALTDEFFAGEGLRGKARTVFFVGDEKQSIYGFQGAAPERLPQEIQDYVVRVEGAGGDFRQVPLNQSRRSVAQVLGFVDQVCNRPDVRPALQPGEFQRDDIIEHAVFRSDPGCVDLWPLEARDEAEEPDYWMPVNAQLSQSANKRLARRIAGEIKRLIQAGEGTAGDVLILVRRRKVLFEEIIRALKQVDVPVAGADRLKLTGHIAVLDLLALGRVSLFPGDDLSLAALLRSPLTDIGEESLFDLAYGRKGSLWSTLVARAEERAEWREAKALLDWAATESTRRAPFDFYSRLLCRLDAQGLSMRQRFARRLGEEGGEVLDEFLNQAHGLERADVVSLQAFIDAMSALDVEVKRQQEEAGGKVRVMTVHGAKGLEAKIVFMPDTTTRAAPGKDALLEDSEGYLWAPRSGEDIPASTALREARKDATLNESLRLLYVGMTRAKDRLVICGVRRDDRKLGMEEGCWYDVLAQAHGALEDRRTINQGDFTFARYGADPSPAEAKAASGLQVTVPDWAFRLAPPEPAAARYASPSRLLDAEAAVAPSPLAGTGRLGRFRRGEVIHRLLQILPDLPLSQREQAAGTLLSRERDLTDEQREEMALAALSLVNDARFADVFGPGSRAEVAIAGTSPRLPPGMSVSGRLDRLAVLDDRVLVADFKTNRPAPLSVEDADPAYIAQMAAYAAVLAEIFPGKRIEAALVWTDGPKLMPVPENLMAGALARIVQAP